MHKALEFTPLNYRIPSPCYENRELVDKMQALIDLLAERWDTLYANRAAHQHVLRCLDTLRFTRIHVSVDDRHSAHLTLQAQQLTSSDIAQCFGPEHGEVHNKLFAQIVYDVKQWLQNGEKLK